MKSIYKSITDSRENITFLQTTSHVLNRLPIKRRMALHLSYAFSWRFVIIEIVIRDVPIVPNSISKALKVFVLL